MFWLYGVHGVCACTSGVPFTSIVHPLNMMPLNNVHVYVLLCLVPGMCSLDMQKLLHSDKYEVLLSSKTGTVGTVVHQPPPYALTKMWLVHLIPLQPPYIYTFSDSQQLCALMPHINILAACPCRVSTIRGTWCACTYYHAHHRPRRDAVCRRPCLCIHICAASCLNCMHPNIIGFRPV